MTVTTPAGFTAAGVPAGLKASGGKDVALVVNQGPTFDSATVFTANRCKANPVLWSQEVVKDGVVREYEIHPEDYGLSMMSNRSIKVSNREQSRELVIEALENVEGAARDIVALNAGLAIYAGNKADSIPEALALAFELISTGAARAKLEEFCAYTRTFQK